LNGERAGIGRDRYEGNGFDPAVPAGADDGRGILHAMSLKEGSHIEFPFRSLPL
jgi:hypothetical protein